MKNLTQDRWAINETKAFTEAEKAEMKKWQVYKRSLIGKPDLAIPKWN